MKKVFVCSPYHGDTKKNTEKAAFAAQILSESGHMPVVPHLYFPNFLDDNDQYERIRGIELGIELMKECNLLWLLGPSITPGMEYELEVAKEIQIPVRMYDDKFKQINPKMLILDERVDDHFRSVVKGLKFE
ncbi:DUF4406 domain-containing protein [Terrilactibacillus laevilacticus]|uniref:DUF7768 domain-containing protein n=1 Tax=Terrilactibacillus laevilacticus TaxID=1380157 RepID=UPI0011470EE3|nr:DUF4406 domain-containing protein [Terrilactibacillus laevilacticus]